MHWLTDQRKKQAGDILDKYTRQLHDERRIDALALEFELRESLGIGYQTIKGVMIDILQDHPEYDHLAAYYMEHIHEAIHGMGVAAEFKRPLARLFRMTSWDSDPRKERKRADYWENAFALISQFDLQQEVQGKSILTMSAQVNDELVEYFLHNPDHLRSMNHRSFEELIAELWAGFGYCTELTQATRDGGYDIIAIGNGEVAECKFLIECKRYKAERKVGIQPVRSLHGVVHSEQATKGILVTTSSFTSPAEKFLGKNKWILEGRDFEDILEWLKQYQRLKFPE